MKKPKRSVRKKKAPLKLFLTIFTVFLACIVVLIVYISYIYRSDRILAPPLYEEIHSSSADLNECIKNIDSTIYESLHKSGVQEKDVFFLNVQPRHRDGRIWDFSEIQVNCRDEQFALNIQRIIDHDLRLLDKDIRLRKGKGSEGRIICQVLAKGLPTHKLILSVGGPRPRIKDVRPKIAIIIDDLGYASDTDLSFFQLGLPLSFSALPFGPFTQSIVQKANEEGRELLLHLPMEPKNFPAVKPGPGALFLSMDAHRISQVLDEDLRQVKGARGVNNHMGSCFTEDREKMLIVLNELKRRGLFFIDSRTSKDTVALDLAQEIELPSARRRVFLDNNLSPKAMHIQMERLLNMSRHLGAAIGIGHPYQETYELLKEYGPKIQGEFQIVPASDLVS